MTDYSEYIINMRRMIKEMDASTPLRSHIAAQASDLKKALNCQPIHFLDTFS